MDTNPILHIVTRLKGGYAREDSAEVSIVGCFTDAGVARSVALATSSKVVPVVLNTLDGGLLDSFKQLGLSFDPQVLSCTINAQAQIEGADNN
ncbi:hypothetical protein [Pseudomonas aeruginosa]|uniref:hypothetical protein n=1 Tax=Pseudomonas aeruginosa TaxID=287 RepID=UPI003D2C2E76